jgi:two-component system, LuxR family, response regulator FixJ
VSGTQPLVLIVNNDEAIRDALQFALRLKGLNVRAHRAGSELLLDPALASAHCIILDDRMPHMDGFELLRQLEALDVSVPKILLTDHATPGLRARASAAGAHLVLEKPLLNNALVDNVMGIVNPGTLLSPGSGLEGT